MVEYKKSSQSWKGKSFHIKAKTLIHTPAITSGEAIKPTHLASSIKQRLLARFVSLQLGCNFNF